MNNENLFDYPIEYSDKPITKAGDLVFGDFSSYIKKDDVIEFGEPSWACDWNTNLKTEIDSYLVKLPFTINGRRGHIFGIMTTNPGENPDTYNTLIARMKEGIPEAYKRGEIKDAPTIVAY